MKVLRQAFAGCFLLVLAACGSYGPQKVEANEVARLHAGLMALDASIDPEEAVRAARIAFSYTRVLAQEYGITDPPLIHNTKVNMGLRPRGLCWHWAEDMENRLVSENFQSFDVLRAIANAESDWLIDHSTVLLAPVAGSLD